MLDLFSTEQEPEQVKELNLYKFIILRGLDAEGYKKEACNTVSNGNFALLENVKSMAEANKIIEHSDEWVILINCPMYLCWMLYDKGINNSDNILQKFNVISYNY